MLFGLFVHKYPHITYPHNLWPRDRLFRQLPPPGYLPLDWIYCSIYPPQYQYDILLCCTLPYFYYVLQVQTTTSTTPQQQQTVPTPSPPLEESISIPPQDCSTTDIMFADNSFIVVSMLLYSYFKSLSLYVSEYPTMIELIRFRGRNRRVNIPKEIGTKCYQFGVLLLKDET